MKRWPGRNLSVSSVTGFLIQLWMPPLLALPVLTERINVVFAHWSWTATFISDPFRPAPEREAV
jgi:hypothetical protein